jgi:photosystem II stability/assembly factor-like uncharacterized protein
MGFTVAGRDYFLGSGHPDPNALAERALPPQLGLIRSTDAGRTWQPISLGGEADLHVLRSSGRRVYGVDARSGRLLLSRDSGRTWAARLPPTALLDLAVHPQDPSRLVASGEDGLLASSDEASSWRRLARFSGLLAWPRPERLYVVTGDGSVLASSDSGRNWTPRGSIGGQPAAFLARSSGELYAALHDGTIKRSADAGRTWTIRTTP